MDKKEIESVLETFRIIVDTREQETPKARKRYRLMKRTERATLDFGDYAGNIDIGGVPIHDTAARIKAQCVIERKMSLDELAECFTRGRARFEREFQRARDAGSKVYLLVEDASYEDILLHRYRSKFAATAFIGSIISWGIRYNMTPVFCRAETSGVIIREILLRDMRARLEEGEYG